MNPGCDDTRERDDSADQQHFTSYESALRVLGERGKMNIDLQNRKFVVTGSRDEPRLVHLFPQPKCPQANSTTLQQ